jgi:ankyrin repeat protein
MGIKMNTMTIVLYKKAVLCASLLCITTHISAMMEPYDKHAKEQSSIIPTNQPIETTIYNPPNNSLNNSLNWREKCTKAQNNIAALSPSIQKNYFSNYFSENTQKKALNEFCLRNAVLKEDIVTIHYYLKMNIDVNAQNSCGYSALHIAVIGGFKNIADLLIQSAANIHLQDTQGNTPTHYAIQQLNSDLTTLLLENGANLSIKNKEGCCADSYLKYQDTKSVVYKDIFALCLNYRYKNCKKPKRNIIDKYGLNEKVYCHHKAAVSNEVPAVLNELLSLDGYKYNPYQITVSDVSNELLTMLNEY